jgi:hypothetical protein
MSQGDRVFVAGRKKMNQAAEECRIVASLRGFTL